MALRTSLLASLVTLVTASPALAGETPCFEASQWPEADALFRGDQHWLGADSAFSVDLGDDRTLWLFGDTWIDASGSGSRDGATMIRNSVAIQNGTDPSRSAMEFYWNDSTNEGPTPFFRSPGANWYWPAHGIRVDDKLLIFLNRMRAATDGLGFASADWDAVIIENPDDPPSQWVLADVSTGPGMRGIQVGFASVIRRGEYLYAFGSPDMDKTHPIHVARWSIERVSAGDLAAPEWWTGPKSGWTSDADPLESHAIFGYGQAELTIHFDEESAEYLAAQTVGFGPAYIGLRSAEFLTGPWTSPQRIYTPPENARENIMIYAVKAHPHLEGADLVVTYATNSFEFSDHMTDPSIYYPRFVRMMRCDRSGRSE